MAEETAGEKTFAPTPKRLADAAKKVDVLGQWTGVSNTVESQRAPEGTAPLRQREASRIRVKVRPPARQSAIRIGLEPEVIPRSRRDDEDASG